MITYPKVFIGPMSKNIVDVALALSKIYPVGFIPSRRQIDYNGGYVNHWTTKELYDYVPPGFLIERDHGGPMQGSEPDDGTDSLTEDSSYFDIIHIDPWKAHPGYMDGVNKTVELINLCYTTNPMVQFEIGTEQAIRPFTEAEFNSIFHSLKYDLKRTVWKQIKYAVVQSGTGLDVPNRKNIGVFDAERLKYQLAVVKYRGLMSKEHNGDYLTAKEIHIRFQMGLDAINIAPEIGQYESEAIWSVSSADYKEYFYEQCMKSIDRFKKWFPADFDYADKRKVVLTGGHYILADLENPPKVVDIVKERLKHRLESIYAWQ